MRFRSLFAWSLTVCAACASHPRTSPAPVPVPAPAEEPIENSMPEVNAGVPAPVGDPSEYLAEPAGPAGNTLAITPPALSHEFRAAWLSPIGGRDNRDWPSADGLPADSQKAELRALFDRAQKMGLNAIIFHVRLAGDAMYPTPLAPWSVYLTGRSGGDPGYDPLAFAIAEAHARGMQLHAWFNPFRAMLPNFAGRAAAGHVTRAHPDWVHRYGSQTWIDPGNPDARRAVLDIIVDVVRRYDVDAVHVDDYFYPYQEKQTVRYRSRGRTVSAQRLIPFPDESTWQRYGMAAGWTNRDDWRRDNVNQFVRAMYEEVKREKPWVAVGISPFGIWRPGSPSGVTGLDAYSEIYADSRLWLQEGWVDYLVPQLYWQLNATQQRFTSLDAWWRTQNPHGRYVWPGLATMHLPTGRWPSQEIVAQISSVRTTREQSPDVPGHVHFRLGSLSKDMRYGEYVSGTVYTAPALVPPFTWLGSQVPAAPVVSAPQQGTSGMRQVSVAAGDSTAVAWWLVQLRRQDGTWTSQVVRATQGMQVIALPDDRGIDAVSVRGIGRSGVEGPATVVSLLSQ